MMPAEVHAEGHYLSTSMPDIKSNETARQLRIRKYPNRRYYDTTRSRHLTLEEIHNAVRDGYEIQVTDSRSGGDITGRVLAQIIIELDPPKLGVFPVALLHRLLRANEQLVQDFTQKYFNTALTAFLESQRKFEQTVRQALGIGPAASATVADWTKLIAGQTPPQSAPPGESNELKPVVEDLRRQVSELERKLGEAKQPAPRKARAKNGNAPA
jgi:polyhydroxyalkanoate synthesis repressor PhaR